MEDDLPLFVVLDGGELPFEMRADRFNGGMLALLLELELALLLLLLPSPIALLLFER